MKPSCRRLKRTPFEVRDCFGEGSKSGANSGAVEAQKAAPQAPVTVGAERKFLAQPLESKGFVQPLASPCFLVNKQPVEAAGIEPASRDILRTGLYVRSRFMEVRLLRPQPTGSGED